MLRSLQSKDGPDRLPEAIRAAEAPTADLFEAVLSGVCTRVRTLSRAGTQIETLSKASAWTDLALALISWELPTWSLRRLVVEDGVWFCALSNRPSLPLELDDTADASHECLSLAILGSLVEARRKIALSDEQQARSVPWIDARQAPALCCDNFR